VPPRPALTEGACAMSAIRCVVVADSEEPRTAGELVEIDYAPLAAVVDGRRR